MNGKLHCRMVIVAFLASPVHAVPPAITTSPSPTSMPLWR